VAADQAALCALGACLRRLRLRRGLSLRGMARRLGAISHSALVDFEHGRRLLPADLLALYRNTFPDDAEELARLWDAVLSARVQVPQPVEAVAQLPADLVDFVDREAELSRVLGWTWQSPAVVTVSGEPGVGKSSFALHVAHRVRADYPDGQLYVALHGAGRQPLSPAQVLAKLLVPLGVPDNRLPADVDGRAALLRSVLATRRVLIVLDDAADEAQVRPALPGHGQVLVLITSRGPLAALDGALSIRLGVFAPDAALELFRRVAGPHRVAAELHESRQIVAYCGHLPLATRLAAASVATWPRGQLRDWADELADRATRLDRLRVGDRAVNTVFELSYQALSEPARMLFRRVPLLPGPDFGARTAAMALPDGAAEAALAELVQRGMVQASDRARRYRMHDLLMLFAETQLDREEPTADREPVERAVLGDLLGTAFDAGATLDPSGYAVPRPESRFADRAAAVRWLDAEYRCVVAGLRRAAELGRTELVFPLLVALPWYWDLRCHWDEWRDVNTAALDLAETVGDGLQQVIALNGLCIALRSIGDGAAAIEHGRAAVRLAREIDRPDEEAGALDRLGCALDDLGQHETAVSLFTDAIRLNEQLGELWSLASTRRHLGEALRALGRLDEASAAFQRAAREFAELDATRSQAMTFCGHAEVMLDRGALEEAAGLCREAMESFRAHDDHWGVAYARLGLGRVFAAAGRREDAVRELTSAVDAFAEVGDNSYQAAALRALAMLSDASA
jgi:tetratricopeptide (TPR) repeat protein/transcriptional regulator with XRE-family HTH domain